MAGVAMTLPETATDSGTFAPEMTSGWHYHGNHMTAVAHIPVVDFQSVSLTDADLMRRFVECQDSEAFKQLVLRHSALVLGVGRRVLQDTHDVDDVFQATFLVLVRDAGRVRKQKSIASWLYGVAYRLALRVARQKHRRRETRIVEDLFTEIDTLHNLSNRHDLLLLDAELNALPERYRQPLVLRFLAGKAPREIAEELQITVDAVDGLLKRGKNELRTRLMARGVRLGVVVTAIQLSQQAASAAPLQPLIDSTIQAGLAWHSGGDITSTDLIADRVLDLSGKELVTMSLSAKMGLIVGTAVGVLAIGLGAAHFDMGMSNRAEAGIASGLQSVAQAVAVEDAAILQADDPDVPKAIQVAQNRDGKKRGDVVANPPAGPHRRWDFQQRSPNTRRIEAALVEATEVNFTDVPMEEAINYLEDLHHIGIKLDRTHLQDEGINTDTQISLNLAGVSLRSTLRLMLDPLALDYVIKNDVLMITTKTVADDTFETRVYDVSRLNDVKPAELEEIIYATIAPETWNAKSKEVSTASVNNTSASGSPSLAGGSDQSTAEGGAKPAAKSEASGPANSNVGGQSGGSIRCTKRSLIIRQTDRIHEEIVNLLNQLEDSMKSEEQ